MTKEFHLVTINGKKCENINVLDHGLLYGDGIFETVRVFNKKLFLFDDHLERLFLSANAISLKIPCSKNKLSKMIWGAFLKSKLNDAFIRIIITRGICEQGLVSKSKPNIIIIVNNRKFNPLKKINLKISKIRRVDKNAVDSKIKSLNYLNNILAKRDAINSGFDDAILLNNKNQLTEATTTNLFVIKKGKILTPKSDSGILAGVTRKAIIKKFNVIEKAITAKDLISAEEVFLSGTVDLITSVKQINNIKFKNFNTAKGVFDYLMEELF